MIGGPTNLNAATAPAGGEASRVALNDGMQLMAVTSRARIESPRISMTQPYPSERHVPSSDWALMLPAVIASSAIANAKRFMAVIREMVGRRFPER